MTFHIHTDEKHIIVSDDYRITRVINTTLGYNVSDE